MPYALALSALLAIIGIAAKLSPIVAIIVAIYAEWIGFDGMAVMTLMGW